MSAHERNGTDDNLPFVSIVVPTRDRPDLLDVALRGLCIQSYPRDRYEILVAEDGPSRGVREVVRRCQEIPDAPAIRGVGGPKAGVNAARNLGSAHAAGDPIIFTDDDVDPPASWLEELVRGTLRHPAAAGFGGPVRVRFEGRPPRMCGVHSIGKGEVDLGDEERRIDRVSLIGANFVVRRDALIDVGGFDELVSRGSGADTEFQHRLLSLGGEVVYLPKAWLWHRRTPAMLRTSTLVWQRFARGVKEVLYRRKKGGRGSGRRHLAQVPAYLAHAWRSRCTAGLLDASGALGVSVGLLLDRLGLHPSTRALPRHR